MERRNRRVVLRVHFCFDAIALRGILWSHLFPGVCLFMFSRLCLVVPCWSGVSRCLAFC